MLYENDINVDSFCEELIKNASINWPKAFVQKLEDLVESTKVRKGYGFVAETNNKLRRIEMGFKELQDEIEADIKELQEYRATGLTPDQIREMDKEYSELAKKLNEEKEITRRLRRELSYE